MDEFLGIIKIFAGNFAPRGWAFCEGQLLAISQNTALFSLLGTTYGGNGQTTFALPDLRGRVPLHAGSGSAGPGLSAYTLGEASGTENVTLLTSQMPTHNHIPNVVSTDATEHTPGANGANAMAAPMDTSLNNVLGFNNANNTPLVPMTGSMTTTAGGNQPHSNMQPYLAVNYIISLEGVFPSRN
jgi:microcystin-dependent protein